MFLTFLINPLFSTVHLILFSAPQNIWATILLWIVRITTFSLLFRTHIGPWLLTSLSSHVRVRSVSLRSIRGIYFRRGIQTWRVERISYARTSVNGSKRWGIKIDGLSLDIGKELLVDIKPPVRRHNRNLTLADLNPSPLAHWLWKLSRSVYTYLEPYFRPLIRTYVVALIRLVLRWLPVIIEAISFDFHSIVVTFSEIPGTRVGIEEVGLHMALQFTQMERMGDPADMEQVHKFPKLRKSYGVDALKRRLRDSFRRSLDRAWGKAHGTATVALNLRGIAGMSQTESASGGRSIPFFLSPGVIDLGISARFDPRAGTMDSHSLETNLSIGDCSVKVDLVNALLAKFKFQRSRRVPAKKPRDGILPPSLSLESPPNSPFLSPSSSLSAPSAPTMSATSSMFSPFEPSPPPSLLSPDSIPKSPSSPFLRAISASMRPRRSYVQRRSRLKDTNNASSLSILRSMNISISAITLSTSTHFATGSYKAIIHSVVIGARLSDPALDPLHQQWLGRNNKSEKFDPDSYAFKFSVHRITLDRQTKQEDMRLLKLASIDFQALASQWPSPWLVVSPFIRDDANAPLLAVRITLGSIHLTEHLDYLHPLLDRVEPVEPRAPSSLATRATSYSIPRFAFELLCGPICARLVCGAQDGPEPLALELRTKGFLISASNHFSSFTPTATQTTTERYVSLQMNGRFDVVLEPVLVRVRSKWMPYMRRSGPSDSDFLDDPAIISLEMFESFGTLKALATIDSRPDGVGSVEVSSLLPEIHSTCDAFCIELWHPNVITLTRRLLCLIQTRQKPTSPDSSPPSNLFDKLPVGASAKIALARFVVFVTAPDINPGDTELLRGVALRTGISVEYSSMSLPLAFGVDHRQRSEARSKLYLPQELIMDAIAAAKRSAASRDASLFLKANVFNLALRSVIATQYESDDPTIAGRDDMTHNHREFVHVASLQANVCFSRKQLFSPPAEIYTCEVAVHIPSIRGDFKLAHIYSILLALQTVRRLLPSPAQPQIKRQKSGVALRLQCTASTIQVFSTFLKQELATRIDGLNVTLHPHGSPVIRINKVVAWVPIPSRIDPWQDGLGREKWEEILSLNAWRIGLPSKPSGLIVVEGEGARLRIPHGFILADLIFDVSVIAKALKHMTKMTAAGVYSDMPKPEPEGPKSVPRLSIRIGCLCLEAQNDPFESKLGIIWREGMDAVRQRMEREDAFLAKVAAIQAAELEDDSMAMASENDQDYQFTGKHSVSIEEARQRLDDVHVLDWTLRLERSREIWSNQEKSILHKLHGTTAQKKTKQIPNIVPVSQPELAPPLFRVMFAKLSLAITPPSFRKDKLPVFLNQQGGGLPQDTQFSLLVPMHINLALSSLQVTLRDYPVPVVNIPAQTGTNKPSFTFDTDLVIGEEMGTDTSVDWVQCPIIGPLEGAASMSLTVPKTIMPVKSYASPVIQVTSPGATVLSWSVSYGPAIQDMMRIVDTLSSAPRDPSPALGFWDKMRLVFHWNVKASFVGDVRLYIKGSRNPYKIVDAGTGFVLCWQGAPELRIGYKNDEGELVQVISDTMLIAIPNLEHIAANNHLASLTAGPFQKICAKFGSGIRFGVGVVLERSCGYECQQCSGTPFQRACRHFAFKPHYEVKLEQKPAVPERKGPEDSYNGFRSDFIHLSVSLTSSVRQSSINAIADKPNSLHLTPKAFAHFFSWWSLFDGVLTLPIRQGSYYPIRTISPKFGRHLATLKYRVHVQRLFIMHGYMDDSRDTWVDGVTPWVGVKGMIDDFQADMHQREEEATVPGPIPNTTKVIRRKPFDAAEVVLKGLDLRAMLATFSEPLKQVVQMTATAHSNYRQRSDLPLTDMSSPWYDAEDFVEVDWSSHATPSMHLLPLATCPHFTYFKRNSTTSGNEIQTSKFGAEDSHVCLLGREPSVPQVQISLASARISELKQQASSNIRRNNGGLSLDKMVGLLEEYIGVLKDAESAPESLSPDLQNYHMPSGIVSPDEWAEFDNVYQIHCPNIFMDSATRDIILQYYYCSRARRGFEYHMATRAVKFIRDQADAALADTEQDEDEPDALPNAGNTAQIAATAIRKILKGDNGKPSVEISRDKPSLPSETADPLSGWADGVSLQKNNCCLLLKPQIVMRGEDTKEACIVAAAQAKLQSYVIMDNSNLEDPISGKVMSRNYTSLSGLQTFSTTQSLASGNGRVPLEVLIDLRCESSNFERLVPQTDAVFHYDKFNRLRLRNNVTSVVPRASTDKSTADNANHLQDQTDLIRVHIPRFTVSASDEHFQIISNIVTKLLLFSDAAHKTRLDRIETMLFTYDFGDLHSAAGVISNLQSRLRDAMETERITLRNPRRLEGEEDRLGFMKLKAHIFLLAEELNFLFDAIKLAQDRFDDQTDRKSALLLHASSSEISWRMLDERRNLLAKLVVQDSNFYWLSRQDSSTVNNLAIGNLTAFDGSRHALWAEILSKHYEPANHPLLKRSLFLLANWTILPPVGGITIYEAFEVSLHPLRLQIDAKVGRRIMAYVWPARNQRIEDAAENPPVPAVEVVVKSPVSRSSLDTPRPMHTFSDSVVPTRSVLIPPLRKLGSSRSFTDLRSTNKDSGFLRPPTLQRTKSSTSLLGLAAGQDASDTTGGHDKHDADGTEEGEKKAGDAAVMKTRSSQKTFVLVKISSLDILLSVVKEGSFECHDAKIKTRELEYRNQTRSFEELVNQFIPSNMGWKGWVKMVFQQPLVPVLPVARELISKTKWTASKGAQPHEHPLMLLHPSRILASDDDSRLAVVHAAPKKPSSPPQSRGWLKGSGKSRQRAEPPPSSFTSLPLSEEPEPLERTNTTSSNLSSSRKRVLSLFSRGSQSSRSETSASRHSDDKRGSQDSTKGGGR